MGGEDKECLVDQLCLTFCNPMDCSPEGFSVHGDSPGKNTGVGCHALLQGLFPGIEPRWIASGFLTAWATWEAQGTVSGNDLLRSLWKKRGNMETQEWGGTKESFLSVQFLRKKKFYLICVPKLLLEHFTNVCFNHWCVKVLASLGAKYSSRI